MIYLERTEPTDPGHRWWRVTVHQRPQHDRGRWPTGERYAVGGPVGIVGWCVDVWANPREGQRLALDLSRAVPDTEPLPVLPEAAADDPVGYYGMPEIAGVPFQWLGWEPDGAGLMTKWRAFLQGGAIIADLWLHVTQDDVDVVDGVLRVTAGHIGRTELSHELLRDVLPGILDRGEIMGDGQAVQVRVIWNRLFRSLNWRPIRGVTGRGIDTVGVLGIPAAGRFDPIRWCRSHYDSQVAAMVDWRLTGLGITPNPGVTGDQEDQGFAQGFESFYAGASLRCIDVRYLAATRWAGRCMHYLHPDGSIVDPERVNDRGDFAVYWGGRPWAHMGVQFNKPRELGPGDANGWGADEMEHRFIHTVAAAYELTGCPGLQEELRHWAMVYLGSETLNPSWSSSTLFVSRALAWNCLVAVHLWRLLNDRTLAERVKARCIPRIEMHRQRWGNGFWDVRPADRRWISSEDCTQGVMLWQQAVGSFGVYIAAEVFGREDFRGWAANAARQVTFFGYDRAGREWEYVGLDRNGDAQSPVNYVDGVNAYRRSGFYRHAWMPLALWVTQEECWRYCESYLALMDQAAESTATNAWERPLDWFPPVRAR